MLVKQTVTTQQTRPGERTMKSYNKYPDWVSCPTCGSDEVDVYASYDREIGFLCQDCGAEADPSLGEYVYEDDDEADV